MSEHQLLEEIREELRHLREDFNTAMTANDDALTALQAAQAQLSTDVEALIAAIPTGSSDDISAGVDAVTSSLTSLDSQVTAATEGLTTPASPAPAAPAEVPTADAPVDTPAAPPAPTA